MVDTMLTLMWTPFCVFKVYLIEIQINSNLFQIQLKLVQTWKLDQITSNL
jgi:hypothetical protein